MAVEQGVGKACSAEEPATVPGPASYEEELKDYSKTGNDDPIDNLPDCHPEPAPKSDS